MKMYSQKRKKDIELRWRPDPYAIAETAAGELLTTFVQWELTVMQRAN